MGEDAKMTCPCGCGTVTVRGRYAYGHKPGAARRPVAAAKGAKNGTLVSLLMVPADDPLCDNVWEKLSLPEKVTALNAVYAARAGK